MDVIRKNEVYTVSITGYSSEGLGVARVDGQVLFVHGGIAGEECDVLVMKVLKNTAFGKVVAVRRTVRNRHALTLGSAAAVHSGIWTMRKNFPPSGRKFGTRWSAWAARRRQNFPFSRVLPCSIIGIRCSIRWRRRIKSGFTVRGAIR